MRAVAVCVLLLPLVVGCASVRPSFETPAIQLAGVRLAALGLTEQRFVLDLAVSNPNVVALPIGAIDYTLDLGGERFASGSSLAPLRVPAAGSETLSVEVRTDLLESARSLSRLVMSGGATELDYALSGAFRLDLPFSRPLAFSERGRVRVTR